MIGTYMFAVPLASKEKGKAVVLNSYSELNLVRRF